MKPQTTDQAPHIEITADSASSLAKPARQASVQAAQQLATAILGDKGFDTTTIQAVKAGLPQHEIDSGGLRAMFIKFASWKGLGQLFSAVSCPARVKRHNTSSWITGRIKNRDYVMAKVPISAVRSQHSLDGMAVEKTAERAKAVLSWLRDHPEESTLSNATLQSLAGSSGALKVGCQTADKLITLDGVGRLEAIRQAKEAYKVEAGHEHPLSHIECYVTRLKDEEYESLYRTSSYFRDENGVQLDEPNHDLTPYSGIPRLLAGTAMNIVKQSIEPSLEKLTGEFERRVPQNFFEEPAQPNSVSAPPAQR